MSASPIFVKNEAVNVLMDKVTDLAVLPHVVYRVLEISGTSDSAAADLERVVVVDPGFSSKLLTLANSAFYGLPRKVTSIREAITFLGFKTIRQIAMTVGIFDMFVGKTDEDSLRRRTWWRHSVDSGVCARYIAQKIGKVSAEDAYTSGLLHWIGKSLLDRFGQGDYKLVEQLIEKGVWVIQAEQTVFKCDHVEVAIAAAEKWGFPESLIHAMNYVHPVEQGDQYAELKSVVAISDLIAQYAVDGIPEDGVSVERTLPAWALACLGIDQSKMNEVIDGGVTAIAQAAALNL